MLSATEAKRKSLEAIAESKENKKQIEEIEKLIDESTSKGDMSCYFNGDIQGEVIYKLLALGYKIDVAKGMHKISWR